MKPCDRLFPPAPSRSHRHPRRPDAIIRTTGKGSAISSIVIDGYNLIGIEHRDLKKARDALIARLGAYREIRGHHITVVFDGWKSGDRNETRFVAHGITVIFTRLGDRADSLIKRIAGDRGTEWVVVTSDRDIAAHAWAHGSVPVPSPVFMDILDRVHETPRGEYLPIEDEGEAPRRGSGRTLSRKEKAIRRVLGKL